MATKLNNSFWEVLKAPYFGRGVPGATDPTKLDYGMANNFTTKYKNAAGTADVLGVGVDTSDNLQVGGAVVVPQKMVKQFMLATNASLATQAFWIADAAYTITGIREVHKTAGNDAAAVTLSIGKATGTQAPTSATTLMSGTFNLKGTASTVQTATLTTASQFPTLLQLASGDRLVATFTGTVTTLAGVLVEVEMTPGAKSLTAEYVMNANGDLIAATTFFVANAPTIVTGVKAVWSTAGSDAGTVTYDVFKDTSTNAPGAGTSVLSAAISAKTTANTVSSATLSATAATLLLAPGDRLSVKLTGTLTALAGLVVVASLQPIQQRIEVTWSLAKNANMAVDQCMFLANRTYRVIDVSCTFATAAGGAQKLLPTRDTGTTAPGAGTALITDNTSAGFDTNAVANTVQFGTLTTLRNTYILAGERVGLKWTGAAQAVAGVAVTLTLQPA